MDIREFCDTMVPFLIRVNSLYFAVYCHFSFSGKDVSFLYPVSPAECTEYSVCSDLHPTEIFCFLFQSRLNFFILIFFISRSVLRSCPPPRSISLLELWDRSPCWPRTYPSHSPDKGTTSVSSTSRATHTAYRLWGLTAPAYSVRRPR